MNRRHFLQTSFLAGAAVLTGAMSGGDPFGDLISANSNNQPTAPVSMEGWILPNKDIGIAVQRYFQNLQSDVPCNIPEPFATWVVPPLLSGVSEVVEKISEKMTFAHTFLRFSDGQNFFDVHGVPTNRKTGELLDWAHLKDPVLRIIVVTKEVSDENGSRNKIRDKLPSLPLNIMAGHDARMTLAKAYDIATPFNTMEFQSYDLGKLFQSPANSNSVTRSLIQALNLFPHNGHSVDRNYAKYFIPGDGHPLNLNMLKDTSFQDAACKGATMCELSEMFWDQMQKTLQITTYRPIFKHGAQSLVAGNRM